MADAAGEARVDQALVARVLLVQDRRAFEQLMRRHQGMVRAQLRRLLQGDRAGATISRRRPSCWHGASSTSSAAMRVSPPGSTA
jgi:glutamine synthetase adenylyltransferase